ncbi:Fic family protein [Flavihumibacter profundi]|uniref:hypothetical protein n=1 Tax=Flavihumibacter profundi TaxID=2716883 RepID=UPI001CC516B3|nr:hypothetical protein [Flavihumibacter profundi]MBZ5857980.1 hypothetical protein [Flavihumibacter profundi]
MAKNINNRLTQNYSGKFGNEFVFRNQNNNTFITKYPDRSNVRLSLRQRQSNNIFREAVDYAQSVIADPLLSAEMKKKLKSNKKTRYSSVYHYSIQQFMKNNSPAERARAAEELMDRYRISFDLAERQILALEILAHNQELTNFIYQQVNKVSKATATRDLRNLVSRGIIAVSGWGAGIKYILLPFPEGD